MYLLTHTRLLKSWNIRNLTSVGVNSYCPKSPTTTMLLCRAMVVKRWEKTTLCACVLNGPQLVCDDVKYHRNGSLSHISSGPGGDKEEDTVRSVLTLRVPQGGGDRTLLTTVGMRCIKDVQRCQWVVGVRSSVELTWESAPPAWLTTCPPLSRIEGVI